MRIRFIPLLLIVVCLIYACVNRAAIPEVSNKNYKTKNVIIIMVDGPRFSETWGDPTHQYIPHLANNLRDKGAYFSNFFNDGFTYTNSGHAAIATGLRQPINNGGLEYPKRPSIFQLWLKKTGKEKTAAWVITSKGKLEILSNTKDKKWKDKYCPSTNCGVDGSNKGYRDDTITFRNIKNILGQYHPNLVLINFKEPDASGHGKNWEGYLKGIRDTDEYIWQLYNFLNEDSIYKDKTTLFVTNDHGRHLDNVKDGYISHGDNCEGCRHINLFAWGPDFRKNVIIDEKHNQVDITATIGELLDFSIPKCEGKVIKELFEK